MMWKTFCLLTYFCAFTHQRSFDSKVITAIRNGIENNLDYLNRNYRKINADCLFGVALTTAIIKDSYQNGSHIMDTSSLRIISKSLYLLKKGISSLWTVKIWLFSMLDYRIWQKTIKYKYDDLDYASGIPNMGVLERVFKLDSANDGENNLPDTDFCLQNIVNLTAQRIPTKCVINGYCWNKYFVYDHLSSGYTLTHELLLVQLAKARKCIMDPIQYESRTKELCSLIFAEIFNADYFDVLDDMFDLFLEEVVVCGYEGYTEFFNLKWLTYILKSQRSSGCFAPYLKDKLKTRIKRTTNIFDDGCADHTTGLGVAALSLYYNFIVKENIENLE